MDELLLVWGVNLAVGGGLLLLARVMRRRPGRTWVGVNPATGEEEVARARRSNSRAWPWLLLLGVADIASGPIAMAAGISPITLAFGGLAVLLLAILALVVGTLSSRPM